MFQEREDGDDEKDLDSEVQPLILQGSLDADTDERITPSARKSLPSDSTNCISCKGLPHNGRRITLFLKLFITSMIIACALYVSLVYFTPLTTTSSSSSGTSKLKSELDCTEADGCKGQATSKTQTNSKNQMMPKIPNLTNKQAMIVNPIASLNASSLVALAAGLSVGLISTTESSVVSSHNSPNGSDPKLCTKPELFEIKTELNIPDLYKQIKFPEFDSMQDSFDTKPKDNVNKSTKKTNETRWTQENKLKIFAVLHSHNDAGWGETFEGYYHMRTKSILDRLLKYLTLDPELKFIWCEISFFDFWWKSLRWEQRLQVKKLVDNKQLEFVGGAWVMHDEASPHYLSMVTQLIEGHQWLEQHLKYAPRNGWAIDPFGLSSTSNFLLQQSGFKNTVFSRVHYKLLELLKKQKTVEYYWRQPWDLNGTTDIFVYQMPYGTYDKSGTCGPDYVTESGICTSYQFHAEDIKKTSLKLLEQYRKKATLFRTNNLLMPLGADFAYQTDREWTTEIENLKNIFKYINSDKDLNTEIKFATLDEYFKAVHADEKDKKFPLGPDTWKTPVFSGDFFTYSDATIDYWSGYYTSRIFHKSSERQLMALVRSAQLMYTLVVAEIAETFGNLKFEFIGSLLEKIVMSRRILSLFQHHDGITGTSRDRVVRDYAVKLFQGMKDCHFVIQQCFHVHILQNEARVGKGKDEDKSRKSRKNLRARLHNIQSSNIFYNPSMSKASENELWKDVVYKVNDKNPVKRILVFNSLAKARKQVIRVSVSSLDVKVRDANDKRVFCEIFPKMKYSDPIKSRALPLREDPQYELFFVAEFLPLEMRHFKICYDNSTKRRQSSKARVTVFNTKTSFYPEFTAAFLSSSDSDSNTEEISSKANQTITISNDYLKLNFYGNGSAQSVEMGGSVYPFDLTFHYYKTKRSGLYSFFPDGGDRPIELGGRDPIIIVAKGKLLSYVEAWYPTVRHRVTLLNHDGPEGYGIEVKNVIDIRRQENYELTMKIRTGIKSGEALFTDSNGFQMMRRENRKNLPIQGNFYPMASSAFIEDPDLRMTILAAQPGGIASLTSGQLEIMLDRIINQDDKHGIGQGGTDNLVTVSKFKIILEKPLEVCRQSSAEQSAGDGGRNDNEKEGSQSLKALPLLSEEANLQQLNLLHPLLIYNKLGYESTRLKRSSGHVDYTFSSSSPPCDIHLLGAMPIPEFTDSDQHKNDTTIFMDTSERSALLFHRMGFDRRFASPSPKLRKQCSTAVNPPGQLTVTDLFGNRFKKKVLRTSLSLSRPDQFFDGSATLLLEPMHIHSFIGYYNSGNEGVRDRDSQDSTIMTKTVFMSAMPTA